MIELICGDCIEKMKDMPDASVDLVLTDPPYELGFMGKAWDHTGIANKKEMWIECLRVLKPGGYLLSFGGTRTYHRMACAIEDAGFEVRDMIEWVYGSGFPKSLNIGKAVDKLQGNERENLGAGNTSCEYLMRGEKCIGHGSAGKSQSGDTIHTESTKGTSEYEGWGTALKPAHEPICMARKPLAEKTVAENVLKYGTGGINIDESRVESNEVITTHSNGKGNTGDGGIYGHYETVEIGNERTGRFPANILHDNSEEVRECFPETGNDSGNASRFFKSIIYQAKASKSERNKGCEEIDAQIRVRQGLAGEKKDTVSSNFHPTVKPIALMEYLVNMASREGATVLDPFMGSGPTGAACKNLKRNFIGIELDPEYFKIAEARINRNDYFFDEPGL